MDLFFSITMGMFYLCTILFSKQRPADTEVHLMKKLFVFISVYVHVMYCIMYVQGVCMCVCVCTCVSECVRMFMDQEQDTADFTWTAKVT